MNSFAIVFLATLAMVGCKSQSPDANLMATGEGQENLIVALIPAGKEFKAATYHYTYSVDRAKGDVNVRFDGDQAVALTFSPNGLDNQYEHIGADDQIDLLTLGSSGISFLRLPSLQAHATYVVDPTDLDDLDISYGLATRMQGEEKLSFDFVMFFNPKSGVGQMIVVGQGPFAFREIYHLKADGSRVKGDGGFAKLEFNLSEGQIQDAQIAIGGEAAQEIKYVTSGFVELKK